MLTCYLLVMKRTTLRLNDDLLHEAKARAARRGITLTRLVEESLRKALEKDDAPARPRQRVELPTSGHGGVRPGVNLESWAELLDFMEEHDPPGR